MANLPRTSKPFTTNKNFTAAALIHNHVGSRVAAEESAANGSSTASSSTVAPEPRRRPAINKDKLANMKMATMFGKGLQLLGNTADDFLDRLWADAEKEKDVEHPSKKLKMTSMTKRWEECLTVHDIPDDDFYLDRTFEDWTKFFFRSMVNVVKGYDHTSFIVFGTLTGWATTFLHMASQRSHDRSGKRNGSRLIRDSLWDMIKTECTSMYLEYNLTKDIPEKIAWGRPELLCVMEDCVEHGQSMEAAMDTLISLTTALCTLARTGSLVYSYKQWDGTGKYKEARFMQNRDVKIFRDVERGRGAFQIEMTLRHIKGRNGAKVTKPPVFMLRAVQLKHNLPFEVANYLVPRFFYNGYFKDWVGKTYDEFLDGKEHRIKVLHPDRPLIRKRTQGGYGIDPLKPMSAMSLNAAVTRHAISSGIRVDGAGRNKGSFTSIRKDGGTEWADRCGKEFASEMLVHANADTTSHVHYSHGVSSLDVVGIRCGEQTFGNEESLRMSRSLHLFRAPAVQWKALQLAQGLEPDEWQDLPSRADRSIKPKDAIRPPRRITQPLKNIQKELKKNEVVKEAQAAVDDIQAALRDVTALPWHGSHWQFLLHNEEYEEPPGGVDVAEWWGTPEVRIDLATQLRDARALLTKVKRTASKLIRQEKARANGAIKAAAMDEGDIDYIRDAAKSIEQPSKLLRLAIAPAPTPTPGPSSAELPAPGPFPSSSTPSLESTAMVLDPQFEVEARLANIRLDTDQQNDVEATFFWGGRERHAPDPIESHLTSVVLKDLNQATFQGGSFTHPPVDPTMGRIVKPKTGSKARGKKKVVATSEEDADGEPMEEEQEAEAESRRVVKRKITSKARKKRIVDSSYEDIDGEDVDEETEQSTRSRAAKRKASSKARGNKKSSATSDDDTDGDSTRRPVPKQKLSSKAKGKRKAVAASDDNDDAEEEEEEEEEGEEADDEDDSIPPTQWEVAIDGDKTGEGGLDETEETAFDKARKREIGELLDEEDMETLRCNFQKMMLALCHSDASWKDRPCPKCPPPEDEDEEQKTYCRAKLDRHDKQYHLPFETWFPDQTREEVLAECEDPDGSGFLCPLCRNGRPYKNEKLFVIHFNHKCPNGGGKDGDAVENDDRPAKRRRKSMKAATSKEKKKARGSSRSPSVDGSVLSSVPNSPSGRRRRRQRGLPQKSYAMGGMNEDGWEDAAGMSDSDEYRVPVRRGRRRVDPQEETP